MRGGPRASSRRRARARSSVLLAPWRRPRPSRRRIARPRALIDRRGWSQRQLAERLAIAQALVAKALALLELPADVQAQVEAGDLAPSVAYEVARLKDPEAIRAVAAEVVSSGLSR